jgi:uncharacterized protein (TIGR03067 family)
MRRIVCLLAGVLLVVPSLGSDAPKEYDGATERDELEGTWELVGIECRPVQEGPSNQCVVTFRGGRFTKSYGDGDTLRGSYRLDPARKPSHLDQYLSTGPFQGRTQECIYRIDGDTLRIALSTSRGDSDDFRRPQGFDRPVVLSVYKRVK